MTSIGAEPHRPSPDLLMAINSWGWKILSWDADRHDTLEYAVSRSFEDGKEILVVSVTTLDNGGRAITSEGWKYPDNSDDSKFEFVRLTTTLIDASAQGEPPSDDTVRPAVERSLLNAMENWSEFRSGLMEMPTAPAPDRGSPPDALFNVIGPFEAPPPTTGLVSREGPRDTKAATLKNEQSGLAKARLALLTAHADLRLHKLDESYVEKMKSNRDRFSILFESWNTIFYCASALLIINSVLLALRVPGSPQNGTGSLWSTVILAAITLIAGVFALQRQANLAKMAVPANGLFWMDYLQEVEGIRAQLRMDRLETALHYIDEGLGDTDIMLDAANLWWTPQSILFEQAQEAVQGWNQKPRSRWMIGASLS